MEKINNISDLKKAIGVFRTYGISLTGKRKAANFYQELHMDKIFVDGLIFELEYELKKEIEADKLLKVETPSELIQYLMSA